MTTDTERLEALKLEREIDLLDLQIVTERDKLEQLANSNARAHVYQFSADVTTGSTTKAMKTIGQWWRTDPQTPIEIVLTSPGGYCMDGLGFYDFLRDLVKQGAHVETRCVGYACSMAGILLQAGRTRSISRNSYLMIHEVSSEPWGKTSELADSLVLTKALERQCYRILASRSVLSMAEIRERSYRKDWYMNAREALTLGFVDVIR